MIVDKQGRMFEDRRKDNSDRRKKVTSKTENRRKDNSDRRKENNKIK